MDLVFLTDLNDLLKEFNLELQGNDKYVITVIGLVNKIKSKLHLMSRRLERCDLRNFLHMQAEL